MMDRLFNKYLFEAQQPLRTPRDAQKAVEQLAAQLANAILAIDDKYHDEGGKIDEYIEQATSKAQSVISRLHPDSRVVSHFLETYHRLVGKSVDNEIPGVVSSLIKKRANIGLESGNISKPSTEKPEKDKPSEKEDSIDKAIKDGERDIDKLAKMHYEEEQNKSNNNKHEKIKKGVEFIPKLKECGFDQQDRIMEYVKNAVFKNEKISNVEKYEKYENLPKKVKEKLDNRYDAILEAMDWMKNFSKDHNEVVDDICAKIEDDFTFNDSEDELRKRVENVLEQLDNYHNDLEKFNQFKSEITSKKIMPFLTFLGNSSGNTKIVKYKSVDDDEFKIKIAHEDDNTIYHSVIYNNMYGIDSEYDSNEIHLEYMEFKDTGKSNKHRVKEIIDKHMEMVKFFGVKKLTLHADIDVGVYAWAKIGMDYDEIADKEEFGNTIKKHRDKFLAWCKKMKIDVDPGEVEKLNTPYDFATFNKDGITIPRNKIIKKGTKSEC